MTRWTRARSARGMRGAGHSRLTTRGTGARSACALRSAGCSRLARGAGSGWLSDSGRAGLGARGGSSSALRSSRGLARHGNRHRNNGRSRSMSATTRARHASSSRCASRSQSTSSSSGSNRSLTRSGGYWYNYRGSTSRGTGNLTWSRSRSTWGHRGSRSSSRRAYAVGYCNR